MGNKKRISLITLLLAVVMLLSVGTAYGRYSASLEGEPKFQVKPLEGLRFEKQEWKTEDNAYVLTFSMEESQEGCRIYLAASEGVTKPETLTVTLTLPPEETQQTQALLDSGEEQTPEQVTLTAIPEEIPGISALGALFGSGYVYRFLDEQGQEIIFDLTTGEYILTVSGLDTAASTTSLLRLFVEYA